MMITQNILAGQSHRLRAKRLHKRSHPNLVLSSYDDTKFAKTTAQSQVSSICATAHLRLVTADSTVRPRRKDTHAWPVLRTVLGAIALTFLFPLTAFTIGRVFTALLP